MENRSQLLKNIPNVTDCLKVLGQSELLDAVPLSRLKHCTRLYLDSYRKAVLCGDSEALPLRSRDGLMAGLVAFARAYNKPRLSRVINATGVIVHTNLGRSRLPVAAGDTLVMASQHYSNLEYNLSTGRRGSRYDSVTDVLCELTGAEDALVVNNNAAAVLIALETLAKEREVIVSRGQLVEIGGSFRIPDVMRASGARLVEVGTTNRTHLRDYHEAISERTALLLRVHSSNFRIIGFTSEVANNELVQLGREHAIPVMEDLGSGCLIDLARFGLAREPTVREVVASGMDIVTFSGDKLLGGPQAGILLGKRQFIDQIKKNPLNRALRIDKFTLAALESVLRLYLDEEQALRDIPTLAMITEPAEEVARRATRCLIRLQEQHPTACRFELLPVESRVGGGAMPEQAIASWAVAIQPETMKIQLVEKRLRQAPTPVIGRVEEDRLLLDMRTVVEDEIDLLAESLAAALSFET